MTRLLSRLRARRAAAHHAAAVEAAAWLAPLLNDPARALTARAGAHPYDRPKGTHTGELTAPESSRP
ncbi:hypothetical protein [Nonomuraea indica]|uniref:hypothetical protein n=1 Tax=Nonomuraea indica TaxID=1581193 RepID=UPI0015DF713F|nr:hypothetical protein [Nonomuraea indica]